MRSESTDWLLFTFPTDLDEWKIWLEYVIDWRQPIDYVYRASAYSDRCGMLEKEIERRFSSEYICKKRIHSGKSVTWSEQQLHKHSF